jgi:hypothetical protein
MKGTFTQPLFFTLFRASLVLLSGLLLWVASASITTALPNPLVSLAAQLVVPGMLVFFLFYTTLRRLLRPLQVVYSDEAAPISNLNFFRRSAPLQNNRFRSIGLVIIAFFLMTSAISAQSLLIDVTTSNTTPTVNDVVVYKIRYRCASITNHCFNSQISFTLPDAFDIVSTPGTGGNVANVTMTGNAVVISLISPPSAGAPAGALAAGASGILETKVKFKCGTNGVAPMPVAGTTVNFTVLPTFTATGGSQVAVAPPAVTVPTVSVCPAPAPNPPATNISKAREAGFNGLLQQGGGSYYAIGIPAMAAGEMWVLEDDVPPGVLVTNINSGGNPTPTIDVYVAGVWYSTGLIWQSWITNNNTNNDGDQLFATRISDAMFVPVPGCFRVGLTTLGVDRIRMNVEGPRTASTTFMDLIIAQDAPPGTYINCVSSNNPAWTTVCAQPIYITEKPVINNLLFTEDFFRLGTTDLSLFNVENWYTQSGNPNLYKDALDAVATMDLRSTNLQGGGLVYEQLLPAGFEYSTDPTRPNFWFQSIRNVNSCSSTPTFTAIPNYSGTQTLLRWEYPACAGYIDVRIYFSFRYTATAPLPSTLCMTPVISLFNGGQLASGAPPMCVTSFTGNALCRNKPVDGGDVNSIKLVKGALDASFSRYPLTGNTNLAGDGVYEIFISSADWQNVKQIDIADILPYVGDQAMLTAVARGSAWSEELAAAITVERFKIGTGLVNASANLPLGVMYTTAANPCYLNAAQPTGQVKADVALANFGMGAGCTDFSGATPAAGAKGFLFRWANTADPLVFGEYLKLTVPVRQLTGEADNLTGGVAWNSVAYTATEADDDELLSSEPIKVGLKMIDPNTTAAIGDYVWLDGNANGRQDAGETPVSGVVVSLYNAAGQPVTQTVTSGGGTIQVPVTTITDGNGYYCFPGLTPNTNYSVRLESVTNFGSGGNLSTYSLTTPNAVADDVDSDATLGTLAGSPVTPRPQISSPTLGPGTQTKTYDFGFVCLGSISGYVWMDTDKEGDQDNTEMGLSGITVTLHDAVTDAAIGSPVMTNSSGNFTLSNVPAGTYYVEFTTLPGTKVPTSKDATGNDNNDSDVNANGRTNAFTLGSCDFLKFDLGLKDIPLNPASICGTAWDDLNKDGTFDAPAEPGIANITVQLLNSSGFVINSTVTDPFGEYCFNNLDPNVGYQVAFVPPSITIMFSSAGPDQDVDLTTGITTLTYTPINDETINGVDAGFMGPLSIGNLVWKDINDDGLYDPAEPTFSGIPVRLIASDGTTLLASTTTDGNGRYLFKNLMAGTYFVESGVPNGGFRSSTDIATSTNPNDIDSDDNGVGTASTGFVRSSLITLANDGGTPGDANWIESDALQQINGMIDPAVNPKAYYTVDFGFVCAQPSVPVFTQIVATCNLLVPNNNGSITLTSAANATHFGISTLNAATYNGPTTIGSATAIALPQLIRASIPNAGGTYIVRLFNSVGDCFVDVPVVAAVISCNCPTIPCGGTTVVKN